MTRLTVPTHYPAHQAATTAAFAAPNPDRTLVGTDGRQPAQLTLPGT